jgi:PhnB protein
MQVQPYLFFDGRCDEAIEFYKKMLGANVDRLMRWKDSPDKSMCSPGNEDKVMHASLTIGETRVMASDGRNTGNPKFDGFALSVNAKNDADADRLFNGLHRWKSRNAARQDVLFASLRDDAGQIWRQLDGDRRTKLSAGREECRRWFRQVRRQTRCCGQAAS